VNVSVSNITIAKRARIIIGRPVKWIEKLNVSGNERLVFEIPLDAINISVLTDNEIDIAEQEIDAYDDVVEKSDRKEIVDGTITGLVSFDLNRDRGILAIMWEWVKKFFRSGLTGRVVSETDLRVNVSEVAGSKIVDVSKVVEQTGAAEVAVEYYTPGPSVIEEEISNGKRLTVSAPDELNYTDVLAYVEIPEIFRVGEGGGG